jgi:two-component system response regulator HupR/HoxA
MPPLREIRADIPMLAMFFLRKQNREMEREVTGFSAEAMKTLTAYSWPGNVRELENEVRRAVVLTSGNQVAVDDLSESVREEEIDGSTQESETPLTAKELKQKLKDRVTTLEIQMIRGAMTQTDGDKRRTAKLLGLSHQGLLNKLKRYGLQ